MQKKKHSLTQESSSLTRAILLVVLFAFVLISVYPLIYMLILSLKETTTMKLTWENVFALDYTLANYQKALRGANFGRCFVNSTLVTIYAVVASCLTSSMSAYAFAKKKFPGKNWMFMVYMATMVIPSQVTLIPCYLILKTLGLLNTYTAMALPTCTAFGTILIHQFLTSLPNDLLEAADIDGCNEVRKFVGIVIPLIKPVLISLAIFTFINVWGSMILPMIVTTKAEMQTLPIAIATIKTNELTDYGLMMATSTISFLPPFILYLFLQKQFVEGIALSGTKM